jgi:hypothetical protein
MREQMPPCELGTADQAMGSTLAELWYYFPAEEIYCFSKCKAFRLAMGP